MVFKGIEPTHYPRHCFRKDQHLSAVITSWYCSRNRIYGFNKIFVGYAYPYDKEKPSPMYVGRMPDTGLFEAYIIIPPEVVRGKCKFDSDKLLEVIKNAILLLEG